MARQVVSRPSAVPHVGQGYAARAVVVLLLSLTAPPLEFVPFAGTAPIAVFGLALMFCDGLLMALHFALSAIAAAAAFAIWASA